MNSSGIPDQQMLEVAFDPVGLSLDTSEVVGSGFDELQLGASRCELGDGLLEVGVGHFVGIEFGAVARQVEDFDGIGMPGQPGFDWLGVVNPEVVEDQVDLLVRVFDQPGQKVDEDVGVQRAVKDLPAHLPLVGDAGDDRQAVAAVGDPDHRRLAFGCEAAARAYFNKSAKDLTRNEAAMIAACLPNPKIFTVKPLSHYVSMRSQWILRQMANLESDPDIKKLLE